MKPLLLPFYLEAKFRSSRHRLFCSVPICSIVLSKAAYRSVLTLCKSTVFLYCFYFSFAPFLWLPITIKYKTACLSYLFYFYSFLLYQATGIKCLFACWFSSETIQSVCNVFVHTTLFIITNYKCSSECFASCIAHKAIFLQTLNSDKETPQKQTFKWKKEETWGVDLEE